MLTIGLDRLRGCSATFTFRSVLSDLLDPTLMLSRLLVSLLTRFCICSVSRSVVRCSTCNNLQQKEKNYLKILQLNVQNKC